jgi:hypothetical protein
MLLLQAIKLAGNASALIFRSLGENQYTDLPHLIVSKASRCHAPATEQVSHKVIPVCLMFATGHHICCNFMMTAQDDILAVLMHAQRVGSHRPTTVVCVMFD